MIRVGSTLGIKRQGDSILKINQPIATESNGIRAFPPWSLWMIGLFVLSYTPISPILGTLVGHIFGLCIRSINKLFNIAIDLHYVILVAAMLGSIIPFLFFIFITQILLKKTGYTWQNVWVSYNLNARNICISFLIGMGLALVAFSILSNSFSQQNVMTDLSIGYWGNLIFSLTNYVFIAVFFEEIFFRGFFYQALRKKYPMIISALASTLFFTFNHIFYNSNIANLGIIFVFGIVAAILFERTRSLHCNLVLHSVYNGSLLYLWL